MTLIHSRLQELLHYDPQSGIFTWKKRLGTSRGVTAFNTSFAGKIAGASSGHGYLKLGIDGKQHLAHRIAWFYITGKMPLNLIDHKDLNPMNNSWENLREATFSQNNMKRSLPKNNTSGYVGVWFNGKTWVADIWCKGKKFRKGGFSTPELAFEHRKEMERTHFPNHTSYG